jgi:hypothetical protein
VTKTARPALVALLGLFLATVPATGQDRPLLLEVHGGAVVPTGSFADGRRPGEGTSAGPSFRTAFALRRGGRGTYYAGFSQHRFGCEGAGCASDGRYVATGFDLGVRIALLQGHPVIPWVRIGGITTRVETDDLPEPDSGVSDLGFGGEAGFGVYIGRNSAVALNPSVTFSAVNSELPGGSTLRLRFVTMTIGLVFAF